MLGNIKSYFLGKNGPPQTLENTENMSGGGQRVQESLHNDMYEDLPESDDEEDY